MLNRTANIPFAPAKCPVFYGWPILAFGALGLLMSVPGQTIGISVFTDHLLPVLNLTRSQLSFAYMFGTLGSACLLPWAGSLYDRLGSRTMAVVASLCLAGVLLILSRSDVLAGGVADAFDLDPSFAGFVVVLLSFLALRFWGQGVLTLSSHNMVAKWFDRRRGLASGISGLCVTLGLSSAPLVLDLLIGEFGWRGAWIVLAGLVGGVFAAIALAMYRDNPEQCGLQPDGGPNKIIADNGIVPVLAAPAHSRGEAVRTGTFWIFSLSLALFGSYMTGLTFHVVSVFENAGMSRVQAISIFLPAFIVAVTVHLSSGWLSDRMRLDRLLVVMLAAMGLSAAGLAALGPGAPVAMLVAGNGVAGGLFGLLSAVTWAKLFGRRHLGAISGINMSVAVMGSAVGPVLFSQSLTWTGSYRLAALLFSAAAAGLLLAALRCDSSIQQRPASSAQPSGDTQRSGKARRAETE